MESPITTGYSSRECVSHEVHAEAIQQGPAAVLEWDLGTALRRVAVAGRPRDLIIKSNVT
jgi:hypothetical protein